MKSVPVATTDASGGATFSVVVPMDTYQAVFSASVAVVVTGTVNFTVQHTYQDPLAAGFTAAGAIWFDNTNGTAKTANTEVVYSAPVKAIRIKQNSGNGSTSGLVLQTGMPGR